MGKLIEVVKQTGMGNHMEQHQIKHLVPWDDVVLKSDSEDSLQKMIHTFNVQTELLSMARQKQ